MTMLTHSPRRWAGARRRLLAVAAGVGLAVIPAAASAAEDVEGLAALGFNLPGLVSQLVNFLLILILLRVLLWKPFLRVMEERKQRIEAGLQAAEQAASAAEQSQDESRRILDEARAEGRELVARAQETAARLREELEAQARRDAEQIVTRARADMELESQRAIQALRAEFADLTIRAAERVVGQSLDRSAHQRLIDETLVSSSFGRNGNN